MKRLPIIRHLRWLWGSWRCRVYARRWAAVGIHLGVTSRSDLAVLDAIWRGER